MDFKSFLWIILGAWLLSCFYYAWRIDQVLRGKGMTVFSIMKASSSSRRVVRKLLISVGVSTLLLVVVVLLAWFINSTS